MNLIDFDEALPSTHVHSSQLWLKIQGSTVVSNPWIHTDPQLVAMMARMTRTARRGADAKTSRSSNRPGKAEGPSSARGASSSEFESSSSDTRKDEADNDRLKSKKWDAWSAHADSSPFPTFEHPTTKECDEAYRVLHDMHHAEVEKEFEDPNTPETIPHVLDSMMVAILSQATSWNNAKRAMNSMRNTYGSIFAYDKIMNSGADKLQDTIRCGGLHVRKTKIITSLLSEVQNRYGKWDLDHVFELEEKDIMKELLSYKYMGPKSASVVMTWCLKKKSFTVDTHIYRIAGLWNWRPAKATKERTQAHLNMMIPDRLKFDLHFLMIAHGRTCPACRGGSRNTTGCEALGAMKT